MKNIVYVLFSFILIFSSCFSSKKEVDKNEKQAKIEQCWFNGYVFIKTFVDKGNREHPDIFDYYFRYDDKNYFIKISECSNANKLSELKGSIVRAKGEFKNGLWDTNDGNVQSRIGDYFVFSEIEALRKPVKVHYTDGNNNRHVLTTSSISYFPVSPIESSSGVYSGGVEKQVPISPETYFEIFLKILDVYETGKYAMTDREKGSSTILVEYIGEQHYFILSDNEELNKVREYIHSFLDRKE